MSRQTLYDYYLSHEGTSMNFSIENQIRDPNRTFSEEAMEKVVDQVVAFIGARIMTQWNVIKRAPHQMNIRIEVDFETDDTGEPR